MDERLRRLLRAADARPSDEAGARRYERALRAAGQEEALQARFRLVCCGARTWGAARTG